MNALVRDESGGLSLTKIGTLIGQWLAAKVIVENGKEVIANWDSLLVLFTVLIAPELFKKMVNMKYGNGQTVSSTQTQRVETEKTTVTKQQTGGTQPPVTEAERIRDQETIIRDR